MKLVIAGAGLDVIGIALLAPAPDRLHRSRGCISAALGTARGARRRAQSPSHRSGHERDRRRGDGLGRARLRARGIVPGRAGFTTARRCRRTPSRCRLLGVLHDSLLPAARQASLQLSGCTAQHWLRIPFVTGERARARLEDDRGNRALSVVRQDRSCPARPPRGHLQHDRDPARRTARDRRRR